MLTDCFQAIDKLKNVWEVLRRVPVPSQYEVDE